MIGNELREILDFVNEILEEVGNPKHIRFQYQRSSTNSGWMVVADWGSIRKIDDKPGNWQYKAKIMEDLLDV